MFLLPFLLSKGVLISLSLIVIGSATAYGGVKANDYRQTQIIVQEAKHLSSSGKYQEAINKLAEADNKWSFGGVKKEVEILKEENKTLVQASVDYELGKELFDKDKYKDALDVLKKVDSRNINYPSARSLIELAEKKLETAKGEVAGVNTKARAVKVVPEPTPTPLPLPTAEPQIVPQATNPPVQHSDSYCKNKASLAQLDFQHQGSEKMTKDYPYLFSYDEARKAYPDRYGSDPDNQIAFNLWVQLSTIEKNAYWNAIKLDSQNYYYQIYNQCLGN